MASENIAPTRRDLLKVIGSSGVVAGGSAGAIREGVVPSRATSISQQDGGLGWTENAVNVESGELIDTSSPGLLAVQDETPDDDHSDRVGEYLTKTLHTLAYVNAMWEPLGNPGGAGGCWRHTFALSSLGIEQEKRDSEDAWKIASDDHTGLADNAVSVHVPSDGHTDDVAVAARRDSSTFTFVQGQAIAEGITEKYDGEALATVLEALRSDASETQGVAIDDEIAADLIEGLDLSAAALETHDRDLLLQSSSKAMFALSLNGLSTFGEGQVKDIAGRATMALDFLDIAIDLHQFLTAEAPARFDRGVSQSSPEPSDPYGSGGHFLLFDVYVPPGATASIEVSSDYFGDLSTGPYQGSWTVTFPDSPSGPSDIGDPSDPYVAEAELDDSIESREA